MSAKSDLFERIQYLESAVGLSELIDVGIANSAHNGRANLLRRGIGIIGFNLLEDYVKSRTSEALAMLSSLRISFDHLPEKLRIAATLGALEALHNRATIEKRSGREWLTLVQAESLRIHSTSNHAYELSSVSLASSGSNVSSSDVSDILTAFGIDGGWGTLKSISDSIGGGLPDLSQTYRNLADRRHSAAHSAGFKYNHAWLTSMTNEILAISASFDIALTAKLRMARRAIATPLRQHDITTSTNYIFLEDSAGIFRETREIGGRSRKNWSTVTAALAAISPNLAQNNSFLVVLGKDRRVRDWHT